MILQYFSERHTVKILRKCDIFGCIVQGRKSKIKSMQNFHVYRALEAYYINQHFKKKILFYLDVNTELIKISKLSGFIFSKKYF